MWDEGKEVGEGEDKRDRKSKQLGRVRKAKKPSVVSSLTGSRPNSG